METLDHLVTAACNLTLGGGAIYMGSSLLLYLSQRWQQLEPRPKAIQIPLALKAQQQPELALLPAAEPVLLAEPQIIKQLEQTELL